MGLNERSSRDIARITQIWEECRERFGGDGDLLFGQFTVADAMFAPVATRFKTYQVRLPAVAQCYANALLALPSAQDWYASALKETEVVPADEPYSSE
jgi:glutathione S-transferase